MRFNVSVKAGVGAGWLHVLMYDNMPYYRTVIYFLYYFIVKE